MVDGVLVHQVQIYVQKCHTHFNLVVQHVAKVLMTFSLNKSFKKKERKKKSKLLALKATSAANEWAVVPHVPSLRSSLSPPPSLNFNGSHQVVTKTRKHKTETCP